VSASPVTRPAPELPAERRLALVVAVTTYADASLRRLRAPAGDADALGEVLADPEVGGFTVTSVVDAGAQEIRLAAEEFLANRKPDDLLLIYLSCHGLVDLRRRLYFAAADTLKSRLAATGVEARWLLDQLEDCRARRQVVILDCCFSGAFAQGAKGDTDLALGERLLGQGRGRVVLTASRNTEYSFEGEPLADTAMPGSVFTRSLVDGIRRGGADTDNDGLITVEDAYSYAFDQVRAAGAQQTPQRWLYGAEGSILLARSPAGIAVTPAELPTDVRSGLDSSRPTIRLGAVAALGEWLSDDQAARVAAAQDALQEVADNDIPQVADAARALLEPSRSQGPKARGHPVEQDRPASTGPPQRRPWTGRRLIYAAVAAALVAIAGVAGTLLLLLPDGTDPPSDGGNGGANDFSASAPFRLVIRDEIQGSDNGCTVSVRNDDTGTEGVFESVYGTKSFQQHESGTFRWEANDPGCLVVQHSGAGERVLPFAQECCAGDTDAFEVQGMVRVEVEDFNGNSSCDFVLHSAEDGEVVDFGTIEEGGGPLTLDPSGRSSVYLEDVYCGVRVSDA
jgi:Caspase domain